MARRLLTVAVVVAALAPSAVRAGAPAPPTPTVLKFAWSEVVVRGKVAAVAADTVTASSPYNDKQKVAYKVATVAVETAFAGAEKVKEIKVAFPAPVKFVPDPNSPRPERRDPHPALKEGEDVLLFLAKHPTADFYVIPMSYFPVEVKDKQGQAELEIAKKLAAVLADPMKALKSDKAEVRARAAAFMIVKYRAGGAFDRGLPNEEAIPAEENELIFAALQDADWSSQYDRPGGDTEPHPLTALRQLYLTAKHGWVEPVIAAPPPGTPAPDYGLVMKDAFTKWRTGPGKDYVIKRVVPKQK